MNYVNCETVSLVRAEDSGNLCIKKNCEECQGEVKQ